MYRKIHCRSGLIFLFLNRSYVVDLVRLIVAGRLFSLVGWSHICFIRTAVMVRKNQLFDWLSEFFKIIECKFQLKNTVMLCLQLYVIAKVKHCLMALVFS